MARTVHRNFVWGLSGEAQEMLVEDGRVVDRGASVSGEGAEVVEHRGKTLLPSFVDNHCHILPAGLDLLSLHLGSATCHQEVLDLLLSRHRDQPEGWLMAVHYDNNKYPEGSLSREALDGVSSERPILLRHSSGHAGVANTVALVAAGVSETGDGFLRGPDGKLTGVLLEQAFSHVAEAAPKPSLELMVEAILAAGASMRSYGICCASDMHTGYMDLVQELTAYRIAAQKGCQVATRLYLQWSKVFGPKRAPERELREALERLEETSGLANSTRLAGIKIFADGAIGAGTAAVYGSYVGQETKGDTSGTLIYSPERLSEMVRVAAEAGYQVCVHSIGDYSTDLVMNAIEATDRPERHRIEHAMLLSDKQVSRLAGLGCFVSVQPDFLNCFNKTYVRQLGVERAGKIVRSRSMIDAGIPLSFSSDRPITVGDPWDGIRAGFQRPEPFDSSENCSAREAVLAYTAKGAEVTGDEGEFGTLEAGSRAEFQIVDLDALGIGPL